MLNLNNKSNFFFDCLPSYEKNFLDVGNKHSIYYEQYGNPKGIPILLAIFLAGVSMLLASKLVEKLSVSLLSVIQRVFGLLLGALAIEYLISGIKITFGLV